MSIRNGIIAVLLAICIGVGGWYIFTHSQSLPHVLTPTGDRQLKEDNEYYSVQAVYPNTTRLATRTDSNRNADGRALMRIESMIQDTATAFTRDANTALTEEEKKRLTDAKIKYSLNIGYHPYTSGSFASFEFDIFQDTGGAHPFNFYKTLVFDLKGNEVKLGDLFTPGSNYLERIATTATAQIQAQLAQRAGAEATTTIFAEGLAPKIENYSNFVDNEGTLIFFIPPYQAAAYAAGSFEVRIPLSDLRDILREDIQ